MIIGQYLVDNPDCGVIYTIYKTKSIEVYVDTNFAGGWDSADSSNSDNVLPRTVFFNLLCRIPYDLE